MFTVNRSEHNPILSPDKNKPWEAEAVFNGCPVVKGKKTFLIYRAMSSPDLLNEHHMRTSVIGVATSENGFAYSARERLVVPSEDYDKFGCEDPRVTKIGTKNYIFYTSLGGYPFNADNIKVSVAITKDFKTITDKHLVTPFNAKAMALFPEKIKGKFVALLTVNTDRPPSEICIAEFEKEADMWNKEKWKKWYDQGLDAHKLHTKRKGDDHVELGAAPLKTKKGWLVLYSHMQKYGSPDVVFGVEALLLDLKNPRKIIGRTKGPFMVSETHYEHTGLVPHIVFPSGAVIRKNNLEVYYGAADTHCCFATINLDNLLKAMMDEDGLTNAIKRFPGNPIITPRPGVAWEEKGTLNATAIYLQDKFHILYRAVDKDNKSTVGYASSKDGLSIDERLASPIYVPRADFENKGCEDSRIMKLGTDIYMLYTAYDGSTPRVAITYISEKDFLARKWDKWVMPEAITPPGIPNKDASILTEKINGKYMLFHRVGESICADFVSSLDFSKEKIDECIEIIDPRRGMWDGNKVGIAAPPIKTKSGWLLFYHGVSWSTTYRVGAVLLDLKNPTVVKARTATPIFEPIEEYERKGIINNVVFPCGLVKKGEELYMYYGGGDFVSGVATMKIADILKMLKI
jgi:predicted GH43/DUF377 family glycosyl hydrolase